MSLITQVPMKADQVPQLNICSMQSVQTVYIPARLLETKGTEKNIKNVRGCSQTVLIAIIDHYFNTCQRTIEFNSLIITAPIETNGSFSPDYPVTLCFLINRHLFFLAHFVCCLQLQTYNAIPCHSSNAGKQTTSKRSVNFPVVHIMAVEWLAFPNQHQIPFVCRLCRQ